MQDFTKEPMFYRRFRFNILPKGVYIEIKKELDPLALIIMVMDTKRLPKVMINFG